jgi:hypothetical protein
LSRWQYRLRQAQQLLFRGERKMLAPNHFRNPAQRFGGNREAISVYDRRLYINCWAASNTMRATVILVLVSVAFAVGFLVYKMITGRVERTKDEVEKTLRSFLEGSDARHDWDDFVSVPIKDPALDSIRKRLLATDTGGDYPPQDRTRTQDYSTIA